MESHSHHSKLISQVNRPSIAQKPVSYHTMHSGMHRNGFRPVQGPSSNTIDSVKIVTKFR